MRLQAPEQRSEMQRRLASLLSAEQLRTATNPDLMGTGYEGYYDSLGYVDLISNLGRRWRIWFTSTSGNMVLMRGLTGHLYVCTVCAHPQAPRIYLDGPAQEEWPWSCWLGQFLTLRSDEDMIINRGNPTVHRDIIRLTFDEAEYYRNAHGGTHTQKGNCAPCDDEITWIKAERMRLGIDNLTKFD
jgi:hypothetical protein